MAKIFPSLLAVDSLNLEKEIQDLLAIGVDGIHLDIMDGHFVPNLSFGPHIVDAISKKFDCYLDTHLMVTPPENFIKQFIAAGSSAVSFHIEASPHSGKHLQLIKEGGVDVGIAINPKTPISKIEPFLGYCDFILFMTVNPGFGGQKFMTEPLEQIKKLSAIKYQKKLDIDIRVDGGVSIENANLLVDAGVNTLIMGSGLMQSSDKADIVKYVQSL